VIKKNTKKWGEQGIINIEFYNQDNGSEKIFKASFGSLTNSNIKIIKKIEFNKYLVEIIDTKEVGNI